MKKFHAWRVVSAIASVVTLVVASGAANKFW